MLFADLSRMKLLKGATPVPGPTMITGDGDCGKEIVPFLVQMGIVTPAKDTSDNIW